MPKKTRRSRKSLYLKEHPISKLLWDAGFRKRIDLQLAFGVGRDALDRLLKNPRKEMSVAQMDIVAFLTDRKLSEIIKMIVTDYQVKKISAMSSNEMKLRMIRGAKWYDME